MRLFRKPVDRLLQKEGEEALYELAAFEVAKGQIRAGLYAMALAQERGDEARARARYITLRVDSLRNERAAVEQVMSQHSQPTQSVIEPPPPSMESRTSTSDPLEADRLVKQRRIWAVVLLIAALFCGIRAANLPMGTEQGFLLFGAGSLGFIGLVCASLLFRRIMVAIFFAVVAVGLLGKLYMWLVGK